MVGRACGFTRGLAVVEPSVQRELFEHMPWSGPSASSELPAAAWLSALAALPGAGPRRLRILLDGRSPQAAWALVGRGGSRAHAAAIGRGGADLLSTWAGIARTFDVEDFWNESVDRGIGAFWFGSAAFPEAFVGDPEPPAVLFHLGDPDVIAGPRVAIVGTRKCTRYGHDIARAFARDLSLAGVGVVSGLAIGIDAAAHQGAVNAAAAPPVAVVANGLDTVYPRSNRALWEEVVGQGVVLSEGPMGTEPERWRFPARNRLVAALADIVIVVESHARGGSMHTVTEAARRGIPVMAVPGPIHSPATEGTNALLRDGCAPACSVDDVLLQLGMSSGAQRPSTELRLEPGGVAGDVLEALGWLPATAQQLLRSARCSVAELAGALEALQTDGWIVETEGWYERRARPDTPSAAEAAPMDDGDQRDQGDEGDKGDQGG